MLLGPNLQGAIGSLFLDTRWADQVTLPRFFPRWENLMLRRSTPSSELEWRTYDWLSLSQPLRHLCKLGYWAPSSITDISPNLHLMMYNYCVTKMIKMTHATRHCDCSGLYQTFILLDQSNKICPKKWGTSSQCIVNLSVDLPILWWELHHFHP